MANFNIQSNISSVTGQFQALTNLLKGGVTGAIKTVNIALKALAANPIILALTVILAILTPILNSLRKLQPVVDELDKALAALGAAWQYIIDTIGSYLGLADAPTKSFRETIAVAIEAEEANQALAESTIALTVESAKLRAEQREALLVSADQTLSTEERVKALEDARNATTELFRIQRQQAQAEVDNLRIITANASSTREEKQALADAEAALIDIRSTEATQLKEIEGQITGLTKTQQNANIAAQKAIDIAAKKVSDLEEGREIELLKAQGEDIEAIFERRLELADNLDEREQILHERDVQRAKDKTQNDKDEAAKQIKDAEDAAADKIRIGKETVAAREQQETQLIDSLASIGDSLQILAGENKELAIAGLIVEGAASVAQQIVNFEVGKAKSFSQLGPIGGAIAAVAITASQVLGIAATIKATADGISAIRSGGGGAVSRTAGAGGASSIPLGPTVATTSVQDALSNQTAEQSQPQIIAVPLAGVGQGSLQNANETNARLSTKTTLNRNRNNG